MSCLSADTCIRQTPVFKKPHSDKHCCQLVTLVAYSESKTAIYHITNNMNCRETATFGGS